MKKQIFRTDEEWFEIISECRQSGLTDEQWCRENNICTSSFYRHLKILREAACDIPISSGKTKVFKQEVIPVEITELADELSQTKGPANAFPADSEDISETVIRIRSGEICIDVTNRVDISLASALLSALRVSC